MMSQFASKVDYAEWLADKLHNTNDYGKEAAALLVQQARALESAESRAAEFEAKLAKANERINALIDGAREREANLRSYIR